MTLLAFLVAATLLGLVALIWTRLRKPAAAPDPETATTSTDTGWVELPPVSVQDMISGRGAAEAIASGRVGNEALQATIGNAFPDHPETAFAVLVRLRALHCTMDKMVELSLPEGLSANPSELLAVAASEPVVLIEEMACFDPEHFARELQARHS
jgi:hypothetical protein